MIKTRNDPKKYVKREVTAPKGRRGQLPDALKFDLDSPFFSSPIHGKFLDLRAVNKPLKSR